LGFEITLNRGLRPRDDSKRSQEDNSDDDAHTERA
jgi:hypothetical protein